MSEVDAEARRARKKEAKLLKRKRIDEAGGVRPREKKHSTEEESSSEKSRTNNNKQRKQQQLGSNASRSNNNNKSMMKHRFGGVMDQVPCRNQPRFSTTSIAVPGSIISNCQTRELKTQMVGQIARAATIYHVDEIVVFDDNLSKKTPQYDKRSVHHRSHYDDGDDAKNNSEKQDQSHPTATARFSDPHTFMARVLQYCECPQYLRRQFFPMHPDLQFAGLLAPIDAPHHVREGDACKYREGVVLDKKGTNNNNSNGGSLVNCGIRGRPVEIDRVLTPGIRCTVQLDENVYKSPGRKIRGTVVSPSAPREDNGTYWGYTTRLCSSISAVFDECPFEGGYDLKVGTSERGDSSVDDKKFQLPSSSYQHCIIVFGGVAGIEECVDADESMKMSGSESKKLFDVWLNTCPFQGSRTIRSEEAVLISLARLSPYLTGKQASEDDQKHVAKKKLEALQEAFSDGSPSEESSEEEEE